MTTTRPSFGLNRWDWRDPHAFARSVADGEARTAIEALDDVVAVETAEDGHLVALPRDGRAILPEIGRLAMERNWTIDEPQVERGELDEVFRRITSGEEQHA